jgi:biopolymer transport protein ExbB/TolQ
LQQFIYYVTHLEAIMMPIGTAIFVPALIVLMVSLIWIAFQAGVVVFELVRRFSARRKLDVNAAASDLGSVMRSGNRTATAGVLERFRYGPVTAVVTDGFSNGDYSRIHAAKLLNDAEQKASRRLESTRVFSRLGPLLALVTTLIPVSPALVALSSGNIQALSANLIVAFSSTVIGLLVGAGGYLLSVVRERMYEQDLSDIEYVLERAGV